MSHFIVLSRRTGCGKNSFFYSSDATTSGAATQSSPNVSSPSGFQVITGRHGYIKAVIRVLDCSYIVYCSHLQMQYQLHREQSVHLLRQHYRLPHLTLLVSVNTNYMHGALSLH